MSGYADAAGRALPWTTISENFWCHGLSRKKGTSRNTLFRTGRWPVAVVMRPTFLGDSTNCRNSAAARCRAGSRANITHTQPPVPVELVPAASCGIGATSHFANSAAGRPASRSPSCQFPPRNIAASPATAADVSCW